MPKRYRITVTEMGQEKRQVGGQWKDGAGREGGYGYTPEHEAHRDFERDVFTQETDELDLPNLVRVINPS